MKTLLVFKKFFASLRLGALALKRQPLAFLLDCAGVVVLFVAWVAYIILLFL